MTSPDLSPIKHFGTDGISILSRKKHGISLGSLIARAGKGGFLPNAIPRSARNLLSET